MNWPSSNFDPETNLNVALKSAPVYFHTIISKKFLTGEKICLSALEKLVQISRVQSVEWSDIDRWCGLILQTKGNMIDWASR